MASKPSGKISLSRFSEPAPLVRPFLVKSVLVLLASNSVAASIDYDQDQIRPVGVRHAKHHQAVDDVGHVAGQHRHVNAGRRHRHLSSVAVGSNGDSVDRPLGTQHKRLIRRAGDDTRGSLLAVAESAEPLTSLVAGSPSVLQDVVSVSVRQTDAAATKTATPAASQPKRISSTSVMLKEIEGLTTAAAAVAVAAATAERESERNKEERESNQNVVTPQNPVAQAHLPVGSGVQSGQLPAPVRQEMLQDDADGRRKEDAAGVAALMQSAKDLALQLMRAGQIPATIATPVVAPPAAPVLAPPAAPVVAPPAAPVLAPPAAPVVAPPAAPVVAPPAAPVAAPPAVAVATTVGPGATTVAAGVTTAAPIATTAALPVVATAAPVPPAQEAPTWKTAVIAGAVLFVFLLIIYFLWQQWGPSAQGRETYARRGSSIRATAAPVAKSLYAERRSLARTLSRVETDHKGPEGDASGNSDVAAQEKKPSYSERRRMSRRDSTALDPRSRSPRPSYMDPSDGSQSAASRKAPMSTDDEVQHAAKKGVVRQSYAERRVQNSQTSRVSGSTGAVDSDRADKSPRQGLSDVST